MIRFYLLDNPGQQEWTGDRRDWRQVGSHCSVCLSRSLGGLGHRLHLTSLCSMCVSVQWVAPGALGLE